MDMMKDTLIAIFTELNDRIEAENKERDEDGRLKVAAFEVRVFGQATLLANEMVAQVIPLQMTNDLDAVFEANEYFAIHLLRKEILPKFNLELDSDSEKVWIPPGSTFETILNLKYLRVKILDPESALVSKAVKAKEKNKILIVDAIASKLFPDLVQRIEEHGGELEYFLKD